eukprot:TRINITY_DN13229_c0_g1_i1.p1 TRINITY_DN13229_c0_g1~~TRINITY_DN13229_c0_g1_i1.p1  ORF type:complete len:159 (-),score=11.56 TRINITY_DN13229_c0_g1_i1:139-615(-)
MEAELELIKMESTTEWTLTPDPIYSDPFESDNWQRLSFPYDIHREAKEASQLSIIKDLSTKFGIKKSIRKWKVKTLNTNGKRIKRKRIAFSSQNPRFYESQRPTAPYNSTQAISEAVCKDLKTSPIPSFSDWDLGMSMIGIVTVEELYKCEASSTACS